MGKNIDLVGQRFGRLVAQKRVNNDARGQTRYECLCDCGEISIALSANLRRRFTTSCGCSQGKYTHGLCRTPEHSVWHSMMQRCHNSNNSSFCRYGAKGITVCESWCNFENFFNDMGKRPSPNHSIDRIDGTKGYYKENCRWATCAEQNRNTSRNILISFMGKTQCLKDWSVEFCIPYSTLSYRIKKFSSIEEAFSNRSHNSHLIEITP
jgi:hypothetical protein